MRFAFDNQSAFHLSMLLTTLLETKEYVIVAIGIY